MNPWKLTLLLNRTSVWLLLTDEEQNELLKARLPRCYPTHPRALMTLLEGLALWSGRPLTVAIGVAGRSDPSSGAWLFGPDRWPEPSALLAFEVLAARPARRRTIPGVGDFRQLRLLHRTGRCGGAS